MQLTKGKIIFIKNNVTRYVYSARGWFKAFKTFVKGTIPKKNTSGGSESKLVSIVRS
jgi:hypothetical protein